MIVLTNANITCCPVIYRFLHQIKEENSELINKLWTDIQQKVATQSQITASSGTPSSASPLGEQKGLVPPLHYFSQSSSLLSFLNPVIFKGMLLGFHCLSLIGKYWLTCWLKCLKIFLWFIWDSFGIVAALNATSAVKRIHTRPQPEEATETLDSSYVVGQVLNSRKQKQLLNKGSVS